MVGSRGPSKRRAQDIKRLEESYGAPFEMTLDIAMRDWEFDLLRYSKRDGRFRDATIFIPRGDKLVCIVKHAYPDGIARPPSGGVVPGEPLDAAAEREAYEETGLRVRIAHYLVRAECSFTRGSHSEPSPFALAEASRTGKGDEYIFDALARYAVERPPVKGEPEHWESHVFWAEPIGGDLAPLDTREIRDVRLVEAEELEGPIHARMLQSGIGGFTYRVALQEAAIRAARKRGLLPPRKVTE